MRDILNAIKRIQEHSRSGKAAFVGDEMLQVWVVHHLEIVGESAKGLSEQFRKAHPDVPWREVVRMRDRLIHGYWDIDLDTVWEVVRRDLPLLKAELKPRT